MLTLLQGEVNYISITNILFSLTLIAITEAIFLYSNLNFEQFIHYMRGKEVRPLHAHNCEFLEQNFPVGTANKTSFHLYWALPSLMKENAQAEFVLFYFVF